MEHNQGGATKKFKKPKVSAEISDNKEATLGFSFD